jgi:excisionase family DNA binding protein
VTATALERHRLPRRTYTVAEVAELVGVSERGLRNQIASGAFPVRPLTGLGRRTVLPRAEVHSYIRGEHPSQQHQKTA